MRIDLRQIRAGLAIHFSRHPAAFVLDLYNDHELKPVMRQRVWKHLQNCDACCAHLRSTVQIRKDDLLGGVCSIRLAALRESLFVKIERAQTTEYAVIVADLRALLGEHVLAQLDGNPSRLPTRIASELSLFLGTRAANQFAQKLAAD